ncbi:MAG: response regulator [Rhodospirillaceae bacterium]
MATIAPNWVASDTKALPPDEDSGRLVVVVEDDRLVRVAVAAYLRELGCEVVATSRADQAALVLSSLHRQPRLILCDYGLIDGEDGLQVLAEARRQLGGDVMAYLMTGMVGRDVLNRCEEAGIPVLFKPVSPDALANIVHKVCR